jgi:hypothetical protein
VIEAAESQTPVSGLTHGYYRYPARFSPAFAAAAIEAFSLPGDTILDPFVGGGTTVVEALVRDRRIIGTDVNNLALFITEAKTTPLSSSEITAVRRWACCVREIASYRYPRERIADVLADENTRNLTDPGARSLKKAVAIALDSARSLRSPRTRAFARCAVLHTGQWALDGRKTPVSLKGFIAKLVEVVRTMLAGMAAFAVRSIRSWPQGCRGSSTEEVVVGLQVDLRIGGGRCSIRSLALRVESGRRHPPRQLPACSARIAFVDFTYL